MHQFTARALLLLMLLTVFGQVTAQPCVDMQSPLSTGHPASTEQAPPAHDDMGSSARVPGMEHCDNAAMTGKADSSHCDDTAVASDDCAPECSCCPGHCASAVPVADSHTPLSPRHVPECTYREIASTPHPESEFRPPITG
ncbi:hypothetical protein [Microbulbifer sediminum]|uniref:hypothetical protein n=1 Tax=Microbulbifer sediminum TaxID=2904250 RepID=UPI001F1AE6BC|nr:hypothetical protein [Microbulbifer sediminum]